MDAFASLNVPVAPTAHRDAAAERQRFGSGQRLSPAQERYFEDSMAVDIGGDLARVYHGSAVEFSEFDPATVGRGNDQWGNGFYFTDMESMARGYANDSGSPEANVKEFYLNIKNPIRIDGTTQTGLDSMRFGADEAVTILSRHPGTRLQPNEEGPDGETNPLGDYASEFWDKTEHTAAELDELTRKVARDYFSDTGWTELETFFGRDRGAEFLQAMHATPGHDGVIVDFGEDGQHYVAWFPEQMKLTSNAEPDKSSTF
jgi:hypothetical protein